MKQGQLWSKNIDRNQKILRLFQDLQDIGKVAASTGLSADIVRSVVNQSGAKLPRPGRGNQGVCAQNSELVLSLANDGVTSWTEIARRVGTNFARVKNYLTRMGITQQPIRRVRELCPQWKGGVHIDKHGYVMILSPDHPRRRKHTGYVYEHRLVMEKMIGRYLLPNEVVHHLDGCKSNNAPENLQLFSENSVHLAIDLKGKPKNISPDGRDRIREAVRARHAKNRLSRTSRSNQAPDGQPSK